MSAFDLEQFGERLNRLQEELKAKPSLKQIVDADLDHNLNALRLMGVPTESAANEPEDNPATVPALASEPAATARHNRHGGHREGAGRKNIYRTQAEKKREYRKRKKQVTVSTFSSLQAPRFVD